MEKEIIQNLKVAIKSSRISALQSAIQSGQSGDLLEALESGLLLETDEECHSLFGHAIKAVKKRLPGSIEEETEFSFTKFGEMDEPEKIQRLAGITDSLAKENVQWAISCLKSEESAVVKTILIRKFSGFWGADQSSLLLAQLSEPSLSLKIAALEVMVSKLPGSLKQILPDLLQSPDPGLRFLAIRALAEIDSGEALNFIDYFLFNASPEEKPGVIQLCFYLRFSDIKPILLKFIAMETELEIVKRAALIFLINPDPETPYRLFEIIDSSQPEKKEILKKIILGVCKAIEETGLIEDHLVFMQELQVWIKKRQAEKFLRGILLNCEETETAKDLLEENSVKTRLLLPEVQEAIKKAEKWQLSEIQRNFLKLLSAVGPNEEIPADKLSLTGFSDFKDLEKIAFLRSFPESRREELLAFLPNWFKDHQTKPEILTQLIRISGRLKILEVQKSVERFLGTESHAGVLTAAIEYFRGIDPDKIFHLLGKFLQSKSIRVRALALEILQQFDPVQALATMQNLLISPHQSSQKLALSIIPYFEFGVVREHLFEFLLKCRDVKAFRDGLCFFEANPEVRNLVLLLRLEKEVTGEFQILVKNVLESNREILTEMDLLTETHLKCLKEEFTDSRKIMEEPEPKPYSFRKLKPHLPNSKRGPVVEPPFFPSWVRGWPVFGVLLIAGLLIGIMVFPGNSTQEPLKSKIIEFKAELISIEGIIERVDFEKNQIVIQTIDQGRFLVYSGRVPRNLVAEERIRAKVIPVRVNSDDLIIAELKTIEFHR